jgi:hypothetical protein
MSTINSYRVNLRVLVEGRVVSRQEIRIETTDERPVFVMPSGAPASVRVGDELTIDLPLRLTV